MSNYYKLSGKHCKSFPATPKFNFPNTGGNIGTSSASIHSFRDCLDIQIKEEFCEMGAA